MDDLRIGQSEDGFEVQLRAHGPTVTLPSLPRWVLDRMAALDMCEEYVRVPGLGSRGRNYATVPDGDRGVRVILVGLLYRLYATQDDVEEINRYIKENKRGEVVNE